MAVQIQFRRGTSIEWANTQTGNPILAEAEMGIETDTSLFKIGDGVSRWNDLPYGGIRGYQGSAGYTGSIGTMAVTNVLYVSKSGNDSNSGTTLGQSKLTIKAALAISTPGTTIFVKSGDYTEVNPMIVPRNVSIVGDNLRSVTVRPINITRDLFWVNNGCYLAHMTFKDHISPAAAVAFNPDGSAGIISTSPYVQNCTSITSTGTGMRVDGNHSAGTKSMVVDAFTQYNQGGIGIHLLNRGYAQLVSVFTINCDKGFFCESGGFCSITNSNSSFGNYALYADGVSLPIQLAYVTTASRKTITLSNLTSKPSVGDAIFLGTTGTYFTVNTSTDLKIGTNTVVNPTISNESAVLRNARQAILNKKTKIQVETVDYIYEKYPGFVFDQQVCSRDIATILNAVAYDMVLGSNYQSVVSGIAYTRQDAFLVTATQKVETIDALQFVKSSALGALVPDTVPYIRAANLFDTIIRIISSGTNAVPQIEFPNPSVVDSDVIKAKNQILANKDFIVAETIDYVQTMYPSFQYDKVLCYRDTGLIVDSIIHDLLYSTSSQSTFAGIQYYTQGSYTGQIAGELTTTTTAINYVKDLAEQVVTGFTQARIQNTFTQTIGVVTFSTATLAKLRSEFNTIVHILTSGTTAITNTIVPNGITITSDNETVNAVNSLKSNKEFIKAETIAYINSIAPTFNYDRTTCARDIGFMIDSVCFDMLYGGNKQAVQSGVAYYGYNTGTNIIGEVPQVLDAYNYINSLTQAIILGQPVPQRYQSTVSQVTTIIPTTRTETEIIATNFDTIVSILKGGTTGVTDIIVPNRLTPSTNINVRHAYEALQANKTYLQAEAIAYVEATKNGFVYNKAKCYRDTGLIVDAVALDLMFNGTSQSTFAGIQYWSQSGYVGQIASELTTTTNAITWLKSVSQKVIKNITTGTRYAVGQTTGTIASDTEVTIIGQKFDTIIDILQNGVSGVTDIIVPNNLTTSSTSTVFYAYNLLQANKTYLANEVVAYVNANNPGFVYSTSTCARDVGYIIDSVSFDLLHGGNKQSVQSGVYYWNYSSTNSAIAGELTQTTAAYNYIRSLMYNIIEATPLSTTYQNTVTQVTNLTPGSTAAAAQAQSKIDIITNIINGGPSQAESKTPISLTPSGDANIVNGAKLLNANRAFIQAEVIAYIDSVYPLGFTYDQAICYRDVGYMVDSVSFDLLYGGNKQSVQSGVCYYGWSTTATSIPNEVPQVLDSYNYLRTLIGNVIVGVTSTSTYQNTVTQITSMPYGTQTEVDLAKSKLDIITTIINSGTAYAGALTSINLNKNRGANLQAAVNILNANKQFFKEEVIAYINSRYRTYTYSTSTCYRDVGYIVDAVSWDMAFNSNFQSVVAGLAYYRGNSADVVGTQKEQTLAALRHLKTLIAASIGPSPALRTNSLMSTIIDIFDNGTGVAPSYSTPDPSIITQGAIDARRLLIANKEFIKEEVYRWIQVQISGNISPFTSAYTYDSAACKRDIGFIVDALRYDITYGTNLSTITAARAYFEGTSNILPVGERTPTVAAFAYLKSIIDDIAKGNSIPRSTGNALTQDISGSGGDNTAAGFLQNRIQEIVDTLTSGGTLPSAILPDTSGVSSTYLDAKTALTNGKSTIQMGVIEFINSSYVNFVYDSTKCRRDLGLIIDSITQDMLFDSVSQSTFAGLQYWNQNGYTGQIARELTTTTNAINYVNQLAQRVVTKDTSGLRYQNTVSQVLSLSSATTAVLPQIANLLTTITNIITNGPTGVSLTSIGTNLTTNTDVLTAVSLLDANREFIQAEVIGYIDIKYPYLNTDICARDIGYIINAVTYDLLYSGNSQVNVAAGAYYAGTRLTVEQEIIPVLQSYNFMKNRMKFIVQGTVVSPRQNVISQDTSNPGATSAEADIVEYLFDIINDILDNGYTAVVTTEETIRTLPKPGSTATTHQFSLIVSTGHSFEWIGAGTDINSSLPYLGGTPIVENQGYEVNGGKVNFTGTDQRGDFRIGNDLVINRINGTISGRTFTKSLFAVMTPYILAIGG